VKSFYDTLGVKKSASASEIKRAFRKKAVDAHPDKGGSHEEMAEISRAYSCLKDPVSRLTYDETGKETEPNSVDQIACQLVIQKFADALMAAREGTVLTHVAGALRSERTQFETQREQAERAVSALTRRRGDVAVKHGINLWENLIDERLRNLRAALQNFEMNIAIRDKALEILLEYSEVKRSEQIGFLALGQLTATTTTGGF